MALIPFISTQEFTLSATPLDLREALRDPTPARAAGSDPLRYFLQAAGGGVEWADATAAPAADGAWHSLPDGAGVILAIFDSGAIRPWFRGVGAKITVSDANARP